MPGRFPAQNPPWEPPGQAVGNSWAGSADGRVSTLLEEPFAAGCCARRAGPNGSLETEPTRRHCRYVPRRQLADGVPEQWVSSRCDPAVVAEPVNLPHRKDRPMNLPLTGGCLCRGIRYEITQLPIRYIPAVARTASISRGSAFAIGVMILDETLRLTGKVPRIIESIADSGRVKGAAFAPIAPRVFAGNRVQEHWCREWSALFWAAHSMILHG